MDWNVENDSTVEIFIFIYLYTCVKQFGLFPAALRILFLLLFLSSPSPPLYLLRLLFFFFPPRLNSRKPSSMKNRIKFIFKE